MMLQLRDSRCQINIISITFLLCLMVTVISPATACSDTGSLDIRTKSGSIAWPSVNVTIGRQIELYCSILGYDPSKDLEWTFRIKLKSESVPKKRNLQQRKLPFTPEATHCSNQLVCRYNGTKEISTTMNCQGNPKAMQDACGLNSGCTLNKSQQVSQDMRITTISGSTAWPSVNVTIGRHAELYCSILGHYPSKDMEWTFRKKLELDSSPKNEYLLQRKLTFTPEATHCGHQLVCNYDGTKEISTTMNCQESAPESAKIGPTHAPSTAHRPQVPHLNQVAYAILVSATIILLD
ncbi:uncharacterized protein LOC108683472 [Hyalella azteca]|uniref:Uncharacterized protein LOC108683472 n=1 Tax=Hyalella azteca TaxID=294128 RepID=A0A979FQV9_HYAAZ|nr:uncharacterized protein LOC108683472 [Hyalella azteca]